jgi:cellulose synthase/poly-beta-1,6-N-acetylglucosamine synthase-like glycosyltransferase
VIKTIEKYLARQTFVSQIFKEPASANLGIVVTIPALAEHNLLDSLQSLKNCDLPNCDVEVIVAINHSVNAENEIKSQNQEIFEKALSWAKDNSSKQLQFLITSPIELPKKHAGAGLARKVAMDEAVARLQNSSIENLIISAFDGDAICSKNYLVEIWNHFQTNPKSLGCSINFEHPLEDVESFQTQAIIQYELHLRYYQAALVYAEHPYANFTVGSSMAVTLDAYVLQGGMNRRKAGEDFWFMLKLMMAGEVSAITTATVYPSARESFRVPFGTGRAMMEMNDKQDFTFYTSKFESFTRLKTVLNLVDDFYTDTATIEDSFTLKFLESVNYKETIDEIMLYTTDKESFKKRFYRWFNTFMVMKFFHFLRDEGESDVPVLEAAQELAPFLWNGEEVEETAFGMLKKIRAKKRA